MPGGAAMVLALAMKGPLPSAEEQAVRILRLSHPAYTWSVAAKLSADVTADGVPDLLVPAASPGKLAVGVIAGPVQPLSKMTVLSWAHELIGPAACLAQMQLGVETARLPSDLWGCSEEDQSYFCRDNRELAALLAAAAARGSKGIVLRGGEVCHTVHAFWDSRTERLGWWREIATPSGAASR